MKFRNDINGLRAMAVAAVVVFHFFPSTLPGGFAGVDVFFVISGYLMTAIIAQQLGQGRWRLRSFYAARAWRLVPAVLVLCAILLAAGWALLLPGEWSQLAQHALATLMFVSNMVFYQEAGYFDAASHSKLLLHTWSLSVEWQFYLLYPLVLAGAWRLAGARGLRWAVLVLAVLSLAWAQWSSLHLPSLGYYGLPSRAWELLAGAMVFLFPLPQRLRDSRAAGWICAAALAVLALSLIVVHSRYPWPGLWAVPVVAATAVLLGLQYQDLAIYRYRAVQWLGQTSYSVYLWHWPVCAYLHLQHRGQSPLWMLAGMALSLVLGALSYYRVERPLLAARRKAPSDVAAGVTARPRRWALPGSCAGVMLAAAVVWQQQGFPARLGSEMQALSAITDVYTHFQYQRNIRYGQCHSAALQARGPECLAPQRQQVFIWGDSYAASLYPGLQQVAAQQYPAFGISQMTDGNGPPFFSATGKTDEGFTLDAINQERLAQAARLQPAVVVMSWMVNGSNGIANSTAAVQALAHTIQALRAAAPATKVVVVGPVPHWQGPLVSVVLHHWKQHGRPPGPYLQSGLEPEIANWDLVLQNQLPPLGVHYVSAYQTLCPQGQGCLVYLGDDVTNLTAVDWGHLTRNASVYLAQQVAAQIFD